MQSIYWNVRSFSFFPWLQVKTKDEVKYKRVHEEVLKRVDKYENDNQPQVSKLIFTDIIFHILHSKSIICEVFIL